MTITLDIVFWLFLFIMVFTAVCIGMRFYDIERKIEIISTEIKDIKEELFDQNIKIKDLIDQTDIILSYKFNRESNK